MLDSSLVEKIIDQGGLFAIFVLVLFFVSRFALMVFHRLFDPRDKDNPGGLVTEWFEAQQEFMNGLAKREEYQIKLCDSHNTTLEAIHERVEQEITHCGRFDSSMVDIAGARLLELGIDDQTTPERATEIKAQIEELMRSIKDRHAVT